MKIESQCLHAGYSPQNGEARVVPICQSTTFTYDSAEHVGKLFDLTESGFFYSRIGNPTVDAVEQKITALEGGVGAICTASGQSATMLAILNIASAGDHIVCLSNVYGGTFNLMNVTLPKLGIACTMLAPDADDNAVNSAFQPNTKALFGETLANPGLQVFDIKRYADLAHAHGVPLIVDNTFATPFLCRPFEHGADIVVHSTSKYLDGHAVQLGGAVVDSGQFDWTNGKFPACTEPDPSYHGLSYTQTFGKAAYIVKARVQLVRDLGCLQTPMGAFLLNLGLETLPLRMERHSMNAQQVAEYLTAHPNIIAVSYPGLAQSPCHDLAAKYLPRGCSGVVSCTIKGGRKGGQAFIDNLKLTSLQVHVADIRTCALHPASTTHRQLSDVQLEESGISSGMVRLSIGIEHIDDILADLEQALAAIDEK